MNLHSGRGAGSAAVEDAGGRPQPMSGRIGGNGSVPRAKGRSRWLVPLLMPLLVGLSSAFFSGNAVAQAGPAPQFFPPPTAGPSVQPTLTGGPSPSGPWCRNFFMPVKEHPSDTAFFNVWGQLCSPQFFFSFGLFHEQTVQVLIPGGAYTHAYWDWPAQPGTYSYVGDATRNGFATLNLDKLGYGLSDHPDPTTLDFVTGANVVHQVVQYLRDGSLGARFDKVVTNGHSFGGLTAEFEASNFQDVNGLIVSGFGHNLKISQSDPFVLNTIPAAADPKFANEPWAPGYFTTKPGSRCEVFSFPGDVDPANCAVEETTKGTLPLGELQAVVPDSFDPVMTTKITAPVLWSLGVNDNLWCPETHDCNTSPAPAQEKGFWAPGLLTEFITPNAGHSINVDFGAPKFYAETLSWLRLHNL